MMVFRQHLCRYLNRKCKIVWCQVMISFGGLLKECLPDPPPLRSNPSPKIFQNVLNVYFESLIFWQCIFWKCSQLSQLLNSSKRPYCMQYMVRLTYEALTVRWVWYTSGLAACQPTAPQASAYLPPNLCQQKRVAWSRGARSRICECVTSSNMLHNKSPGPSKSFTQTQW